MGQRFQSVFILPAIYMNEDNPNNRESKVIVYHCQWLYGITAIDLNLKIMNRIKRAIRTRKQGGYYDSSKQGFINHHLEETIKNAVTFCSLENLHNERNLSVSNEFILTDIDQFSKELLREDNNNGFFICKINKDLTMEYSFISGLGDTENYQIKNPKEYLNLFYTDAKLKEFTERQQKQIKKVLVGYLKYKGMNLNKLSKVINIMNSKKIIA